MLTIEREARTTCNILYLPSVGSASRSKGEQENNFVDTDFSNEDPEAQGLLTMLTSAWQTRKSAAATAT